MRLDISAALVAKYVHDQEWNRHSLCLRKFFPVPGANARLRWLDQQAARLVRGVAVGTVVSQNGLINGWCKRAQDNLRRRHVEYRQEEQ